jgi:hypothetical protein
MPLTPRESEADLPGIDDTDQYRMLSIASDRGGLQRGVRA